MNIQLDGDLIKTVVSEAILKSLDEEKRNALIQGALQSLLTPDSGAYAKGRSPIQDAFEIAVRNVAQHIATEMLMQNEEVKSKINGLITEAFTKVFETNREKTVSSLADAIVNGLTYKERY